MRPFIIMLALLTCLVSCSQQQATKLYFNQIGWSISLPSTFALTDSIESKKLQQEGKSIVEEANNTDFGTLKTQKELIAAKKGSMNIFNANIRRFDLSNQEAYKLHTDSVKQMTYRSLLSPNVKIDSISGNERIDNLVFDKFTIRLRIDETQNLTMVCLFKLYKGYDFGITYLFADNDTKIELEEMLRNSKFDK